MPAFSWSGNLNASGPAQRQTFEERPTRLLQSSFSFIFAAPRPLRRAPPKREGREQDPGPTPPTMGVPGLLPALKDVSRPAHISAFAGSAVAVDAYSWLHKGSYSCARELCEGVPTVA